MYAKSQQQDCGGNIKNAPSGACRWLECSRKSATWTWVTKPPEILQNSNTASWTKKQSKYKVGVTNVHIRLWMSLHYI